MLRLRIDDRAFLGLIRKWLKAGILETDGRVLHPDTGTPQGGVVSPVLATVYLHYALDLWFAKVVKPHCRGEALISRYADDLVCAFRFRSDAEWFYQVLPKRLGKFKLEVAPEKTRILRFSRFHPGMTRRFPFLGFEFFWTEDRQGVPRVKRRTARKKLQSACRRIKAWIRANRHLPGQAFFNGLNARLRGHYRYYGVHGNSHALSRFVDWAIKCAFKWLNRRGGKRKSLTVHLARKRVQPRNRMQENCTSGTVRGVPGNRHSYRRGRTRKTATILKRTGDSAVLQPCGSGGGQWWCRPCRLVRWR